MISHPFSDQVVCYVFNVGERRHIVFYIIFRLYHFSLIVSNESQENISLSWPWLSHCLKWEKIFPSVPSVPEKPGRMTMGVVRMLKRCTIFVHTQCTQKQELLSVSEEISILLKTDTAGPERGTCVHVHNAGAPICGCLVVVVVVLVLVKHHRVTRKETQFPGWTISSGPASPWLADRSEADVLHHIASHWSPWQRLALDSTNMASCRNRNSSQIIERNREVELKSHFRRRCLGDVGRPTMDVVNATGRDKGGLGQGSLSQRHHQW